jgi:FAD/FMN-containing dehydrogenase
MKRIKIDSAARIARVQAGVTWGEFDAAAQEHGLAVTGGRVPSTGVAGLTLGAGSGWLERKHGFACDNLLEADVVTADGRFLRANANENADLFWALKGGGGNFGVVTQFTFQLHEVGPMIYGGMLIWPGFRAADVARAFRDFMAGAPDEVGGALAFVTAPPEPFVPEEARGKPAVGIIVTYAGDLEEGERIAAPLKQIAGGPAVDLVAPMPYLAAQSLIEPGNPPGNRNYWKADLLGELSDEAIDAVAETAPTVPSPMTTLLFQPLGGAVARVPEDATALGRRDATWAYHVISMWADAADDERNIAWTRELAGAMKPYATGRAYLNFIGEEGGGRVRAAFGPEKYARLVELKDRWDPENVFCRNQNIRPSGRG